MYLVEQTAEFTQWLDGLRDRRAQAKIATRVVRIEAGLLGDHQRLRDGVSELRIDFGPGYRLYYTVRGRVVIVLLCGSTKDDQSGAIRLAKELARTV